MTTQFDSVQFNSFCSFLFTSCYQLWMIIFLKSSVHIYILPVLSHWFNLLKCVSGFWRVHHTHTHCIYGDSVLSTFLLFCCSSYYLYSGLVKIAWTRWSGWWWWLSYSLLVQNRWWWWWFYLSWSVSFCCCWCCSIAFGRST